MLQHILYDRKKFITAGVIAFGLVPILIVGLGSTPASSMMDSTETDGGVKKNERADSRTNSESKTYTGQNRQTNSANRDRRTDTGTDRQNRDGEQKRSVRDDNQTGGSGNKANNDGQANRQHSYSHHHHSQKAQPLTDKHGCASGYASSQNHCEEVKNRDTVTHQPAETTKKTTTAAETTNKTQVVHHHHYQTKQKASETPKQTRYRSEAPTQTHYHYNTTNRYVTNEQQPAPKPPEPAQHTTYNVHNYPAPAPATTASTSTGNTSSTVHHVHHNQRVASASTTSNSDNGKAYTDRLPDTGSNDVATLSGMAAIFGTLGHWLYARRKNA